MILACDTSSEICSVALCEGEKVLFHKETSGPQIHIEKLSVFLMEAMNTARTRTSEIDKLALAIGPGSFNGLRIGLATMKALALSLDLPLIPVKTTDALAFGLRKTKQGTGRAVIFSHRNFVHFADYDFQTGHIPRTDGFSYEGWELLADSQIEFYFGMAERGFADWLTGTDGAAVNSKFVPAPANAVNVARYADTLDLDSIPGLDELEPFYNARYEAKKWVPPKF